MSILSSPADNAIDEMKEKMGEMIDEIIDKHIDELVIENFALTAAGDWMSEDIKDLLDKLRNKCGDPNDIDLMIVYLFMELLESKKVLMSSCNYYEDRLVSLEDFVSGFVGCGGELADCSIFSIDSSLSFKLREDHEPQ